MKKEDKTVEEGCVGEESIVRKRLIRASHRQVNKSKYIICNTGIKLSRNKF